MRPWPLPVLIVTGSANAAEEKIAPMSGLRYVMIFNMRPLLGFWFMARLSLSSMMRCIAITFCMGFCSSEAAHADSCDTPVCLVDEFFDHFQDAVPVSGVAVVRGITQTMSTELAEPHLAVHLPASWADKEICGRVVTADGLYVAENTYRVTSNWAETAPASVPFSPSDLERLKPYKLTELAASISLGRCGHDDEKFLIALWNLNSIHDDRSILLHINSQGSYEVQVYPDILTDRSFSCRKLDIQNRVAFDFICEIPFAFFSSLNDGLIEIEIVKFRGRGTDSDIFLVDLGQ